MKSSGSFPQEKQQKLSKVFMKRICKGGIEMLDNYDIEKLNPRKNPYAKKLKKQITINIDSSIIDYFKEQAQATGIPYQTLINLYLTDCVEHKKKLNISWV